MSFAKGSGEGELSWEKFLLTIIATLGAYFIGLIVATFGMGIVMDGNPQRWTSLEFAMNLLPFTMALAGLLASVHFILKRPVLSVLTSRKQFDWKRFFFAAGLWLLMQVVFLMMARMSGAPIVFEFSASKIIPLLIVSLTLLPIQTAAEDVFFRGFLFQSFTKFTGKAGASLIAVAVIFGLIHSGNPEVKVLGNVALVYYIVTGLFLGLLAHFDDGLELGMGYHFANNFFGAVILTNTWQVYQTDAFFTDYAEPNFGWGMVLSLLVLQPAMLFVFYRIFRWKNPLKRILE
ncbi:MAG: CPBP family intramembrane metalloprotease [bacterium]|nr:CPBP family intramembrane metalloprotease [bacterium]